MKINLTFTNIKILNSYLYISDILLVLLVLKSLYKAIGCYLSG